MERQQFIQDRVIADLAEGVLTVRFDGVVEFANAAALDILEKSGYELIGRSFAQVFIADEANDAFVQCVLDAVYDKGRRQEAYAAYRCESGVKQLRIVSSYLRRDGTPVGVVLVLSDITELTEMRDAVRAMEKIRRLNRQLELRNNLLQETFGRYLSDDIVREILDSPNGWKLGGQRQTLTVLMSDLRGFTALSERMEPQDLIEMLNHYFGEMYAEIERYRGTLIEFMGDGMLVIFGAPIVTQTHAADAVAAAIGMQRRMEEVRRWNAEHGYEPLSMGIGINTDEVVLGNIGSQRRTKYGVLGAAVNLTGRIEGYTTGGQILISPGTRAAISCELELRGVLRVTPKGVGEEIELGDVVGLGAPYSLRLETERGELAPLPRPVSLRCSLLDGKYVCDEDAEARLLAVSEEEAELEAEAPPARFTELRLDIGGELYAKVTEAGDRRFRVRFTAKPPCFAAWLRELLRTEEDV